MSDSAEAVRNSVSEFVSRSQRIHFLLIAFSVGMLLFGYVEVAQVREQKRRAENDAKQYYPLLSYAQGVASKLRGRLVLNYADEAETERARIFALISAIPKARLMTTSIRKRMNITHEKKADALPLVDETRVSILQLNKSLNPLESHLYFEKLLLAEVNIGTFRWGDLLDELPIDDLCRLAFAISVSPRQVIKDLSPYVSEEPFSSDEINSINGALVQLANDASGQSQENLRKEALRLWVEWLTYRNSSLSKTAEIETANVNSLAKLYLRTQAELDKYNDWEKGEKGILLPGVPGKIPLEILVRVTPYVTFLALLLMTLFVIQAQNLVRVLKDTYAVWDRDSLPLSYIQLIRSEGKLIERLLLGLIRYLMLLLPLVMACWIGIKNPVLKPGIELARGLYWLGVILSTIITIWFAVTCICFRRSIKKERLLTTRICAAK